MNFCIEMLVRVKTIQILSGYYFNKVLVLSEYTEVIMDTDKDVIYMRICQVVGRAVMLLNESKHNITGERISAILKEQRKCEQEKHMIAIYAIAIDLMESRRWS